MSMSLASLTPIGMAAGAVGSILGGIADRPSEAMQALNKQVQQFSGQMTQEAGTEFGAANTTFNNLMAPLQRIVTGGPNQAGWSMDETNAYNTQAIQRGAAEARDLSAQAGSTSAALGSGAATKFAAQAKAEGDVSNAVSQGTIMSDEQGNKNFFQAVGAEKELPGVYGTANQANSEAGNEQQLAEKSQQNIDTAKQASSPLGMASKALSGIGGQATQAGMAGIKSLAGNTGGARPMLPGGGQGSDFANEFAGLNGTPGSETPSGDMFQ
jgi:hypothetical protein